MKLCYFHYKKANICQISVSDFRGFDFYKKLQAKKLQTPNPLIYQSF